MTLIAKGLYSAGTDKPLLRWEEAIKSKDRSEKMEFVCPTLIVRLIEGNGSIGVRLKV